MKILLIIPPMTQVNSAYPSTAYLTGYLTAMGYEVVQRDLSLELALKLFSSQGLAELKSFLPKKNRTNSVQFFIEAFEDYQDTIGAVINFLQGRDLSLALRIAKRSLLPEGPRFMPVHEHKEQLLGAFGEMGVQDQAKYLASLYLDDIVDVVQQGIDPDFHFSRYGDQLASSQSSFDHLYKKLKAKNSLIDQWIVDIFNETMREIQPDLVGFTVPFPGNLLAALKMGQVCKIDYSNVPVVVGGGFVNTELRQLQDKRVFEFLDHLVFDDGELPLLRILEMYKNKKRSGEFLRTMSLNSQTKSIDKTDLNSKENISYKNHPGPSYAGLKTDLYLSMLELPNPMYRMWSDFKWNKLILAHGCYWKKCTFCDISVDYIQRFEPARAEQLVDQMQRIISETGQSGFHFVDEAAPPALLKALSKEILKRRLKVTWWGNLRFDAFFDKELTELMADAGCVAVTGGLEVASPRILKLINKGVSVEQVAHVTKNFSNAGIYVHAYLMYGFASQSEQETIDSLEVVRQLFLNKCIHSAHWHRFLATVHSEVGRHPDQFGVKLKPVTIPKAGLFAIYEVPFEDSVIVDHDNLGLGLKKALYNYMHGIGLDQALGDWFETDVPKTTLKKNWIQRVLSVPNE